MDEIFSNRPNDQLENAEAQLKTYVIYLERKIKNFISLSCLNKNIETKYLDLQEELKTIKTQNKENIQQEEHLKQQIQNLRIENANRDRENKQLLQHIFILEKEIEQLKRNYTGNNTPANALNTKEHGRPQLEKNNIAVNDLAANSVLIKGFTEQQLNAIPKINIINIGRVMNIKVLEKDIIKVSVMERKFYERHNLKPNKIILIVQLRTPEIKVEFLKNKEKLKLESNYDEIEIIDYVSDEVYNLYQYAKILKGCGYAQIYWRNNSVYAKKTRSTLCEPILIKSKDDVDTLKKL